MSDLHQIQHLKPGDTTPYIKISAINFYSLGDLENGMAAIRKCLHSDPDSKVCKKLLREEKAIDKALQKVNKALEKGQQMTAVRQLVPTGEEEGLVKRIKDNVEALRAEGIIPLAAKSALITLVVELTCQAYYEVSLRSQFTCSLSQADAQYSRAARKPRSGARSRCN